MDDFDLRDLLMPPLRYQSDLPDARPPIDQSPQMPDSRPAGNEVLAMAYVPAQQWTDLYEPEQGFRRGTIFRQLDLPFEGGTHQ